MVKTFEAQYVWTDDNNKKDEIVYVLKENGFGERKCKHTGTGHCHGPYAVGHRTAHPMYVKVVMPWLEGQYNPDIPNYESIKPKEFLDNLAGEIT